MIQKTLWHRLAAAILLTVALPQTSLATESQCKTSCAELEDALVRLAADRLDSVLGAVADSTRALGETYGRLAEVERTSAPTDSNRWDALRTKTLGITTGFRTWPAELESPPAFQATFPGFYSFRGEVFDDKLMQQLTVFEQLVPTFRSAYESFPFSWVYVTTADEAMMIYPYVPIEQAVNDGTPTETVYYQAADFKQRTIGWTPPYLDLVGAGMMVTASYPVYHGDQLLGVMSRDITLQQLVGSALSPLSTAVGGNALVIDGNGLLIDTTDPHLATELEQVNTRAGAAVVYCRSAEGMKTITDKGAVASKATFVNAAVEQVLASAHNGDTVRFDLQGQHVLAAPIARTDWFVVLL